ncbi:cell wall-binding protein [Lachnospiraceae bacterium 62-35]
MKKSTKLLAVLSAAAVMSAAAPAFLTGAGTTVFAAGAGWVEEDGSWRYYDDDSYYLSDTWKKKGNDWYYLDSDGYITTEEEVDEYYVDSEGKRVYNTWISEDNEDSWGDDDAPETYWYYYGNNGKKVVSKWQSIDNKWYYFNEDGYMLTGKVEIEGATYYLGEEGDGARKTGWIQLEETDDNYEDEYSWFYFENSGKMVDNYVDKKINGDYYTFINGRMQKGWVQVEKPSATASEAAHPMAGYQYYEEENGKRANGWYEICGVEDISDDGELYRFYFKNGKPYYAEKGVQVFTVDSKKYGFNEKGEMQTDLQVVTLDDGTTANYYFGDDGVMRTGKQTIFNEDDGEEQTWFFYTDGTRKGQGYNGVRDNTLYISGRRQEADADLRLAPVEFEGNRYLVNVVGTVQKASSSSNSKTRPELGDGFKDYKDDNGTIWVVNTSGIIQ